ncbi:MFS transporter [Jiangella sp. DSM 45060]|uniref:MFS transporter n=1 Tax=Jiangella sp. DSM 45060 TaxID=1798224 RepID=UPI000879A58C|nr:MFS transporter [Jiangella sp. DSM 45060]SDS92777.1 Major Facilitator Superfamily protein [Jiangella sp. DSM 45060]
MLRTADRTGRAALALGVVGVLLAAADTYVIVLALPDMMVGVGLDADELQRAAPLVSMFLLGYVVVLPLVGRVSDVTGRLPVLTGSLLVFTAGSLLTASADGVAGAVVGRFLQGAGGGALVPVTLALVADLWPPERRGVPLGLVGAVQELGSVLGPLFGAAILAVADWRAIFWVNFGIGAALFVGTAAGRGRGSAPSEPAAPAGRFDVAGLLLGLGALTCAGLAVTRPSSLEQSVRWGELLVPRSDGRDWTTPLALAAFVLLVAFVARELTAPRPLLPLRRAPAVLRAADLPGALLLGVALGGIVLTFAVADPAVELMAPSGPWLLAGSAVALAAFAWRQRRAAAPLVPPAAVRDRRSWGALVVSLFVGAALVSVVVDVPILARTVLDGADQLDAALVLLRFLVALPIGALAGGWLLRRHGPALLAGSGMALGTAGLAVMATWGVGSLDGVLDDAVLVAAGLGFGLAIAPVNAALLAAAPRETHGVASALLVVARMIGMLAGLSALTAIGLRRLYSVQADIESPAVLCPDSPTNCDPYDDAVRHAIVEQLQATFTGAAVCAAAAALGAVLLLRHRARTVES